MTRRAGPLVFLAIGVALSGVTPAAAMDGLSVDVVSLAFVHVEANATLSGSDAGGFLRGADANRDGTVTSAEVSALADAARAQPMPIPGVLLDGRAPLGHRLLALDVDGAVGPVPANGTPAPPIRIHSVYALDFSRNDTWSPHRFKEAAEPGQSDRFSVRATVHGAATIIGVGTLTAGDRPTWSDHNRRVDFVWNTSRGPLDIQIEDSTPANPGHARAAMGAGARVLVALGILLALAATALAGTPALLRATAGLRARRTGAEVHPREIAFAASTVALLVAAGIGAAISHWGADRGALGPAFEGSDLDGFLNVSVRDQPLALRFVNETTGLPVPGIVATLGVAGDGSVATLVAADPDDAYPPLVAVFVGGQGSHVAAKAEVDVGGALAAGKRAAIPVDVPLWSDGGGHPLVASVVGWLKPVSPERVVASLSEAFKDATDAFKRTGWSRDHGADGSPSASRQLQMSLLGNALQGMSAIGLGANAVLWGGELLAVSPAVGAYVVIGAAYVTTAAAVGAALYGATSIMPALEALVSNDCHPLAADTPFGTAICPGVPPTATGTTVTVDPAWGPGTMLGWARADPPGAAGRCVPAEGPCKVPPGTNDVHLTRPGIAPVARRLSIPESGLRITDMPVAATVPDVRVLADGPTTLLDPESAVRVRVVAATAAGTPVQCTPRFFFRNPPFEEVIASLDPVTGFLVMGKDQGAAWVKATCGGALSAPLLVSGRGESTTPTKAGKDKFAFIVPPTVSVSPGTPVQYSFCKPAPRSNTEACPPLGDAENPTGGHAPYHFQLGSGTGFPPTGLFLGKDGLLNGTVPEALAGRSFPISVCAVDLDANEVCHTTTIVVGELKPCAGDEYAGSTWTGTFYPEVAWNPGVTSYSFTFTLGSVQRNADIYDCIVPIVSGSIVRRGDYRLHDSFHDADQKWPRDRFACDATSCHHGMNFEWRTAPSSEGRNSITFGADVKGNEISGYAGEGRYPSGGCCDGGRYVAHRQS